MASLTMTRRNQLKELLDHLISATYIRLGLKKKAIEALKKSKAWSDREKAKIKAEAVVARFNEVAEKYTKDLAAIVSTLGPVVEIDDPDYNPDYDYADPEGPATLSVGIKIQSRTVENPIKSLNISEHDGKMVLHYGTNNEYQEGKRVEVPKNILLEAIIGPPKLHELILDLRMGFTAALTEKDILEVLARAKAELGELK